MDESLYRGFDKRAQEYFTELEAAVDRKAPQRAVLRKHMTDEVHRALRLGKKEINDLRKGFNIAFYAYRGIQRRSGEAFVFHVVRGVLILTWIQSMYQVCDLRLLLTLFLHDSYEEADDSWYAQLFVRMLVNLSSGINVGTHVGHLTKKEGESDEAYFRRLLACGEWHVLMAKFVDRIDNVRTLDGKDLERDARKIAETEQWFPQLAEALIRLVTRQIEAGRLEEGWLAVAKFLAGYLWFLLAEKGRLHI